MLYLLTYTLNPPRQANNIEEEIKKHDGWWHHLDFTWIIASKDSLDTIHSRLSIRFRDTDSWMIMELPSNIKYQGWLPEKAWEWLNNNRHY